MFAQGEIVVFPIGQMVAAAHQPLHVEDDLIDGRGRIRLDVDIVHVELAQHALHGGAHRYDGNVVLVVKIRGAL